MYGRIVQRHLAHGASAQRSMATLGRGLSGAPPPPLRPPGNAEEKANEFG